MHLFIFLQQEKQFLYAIIGLLFVCIGVIYSFAITPPQDFPSETIIIISEGETLGEIANQLHSRRVITSPKAFIRLVILLGGESGVQAGSYFFDTPQNALAIAKRLINGQHGLTPVRVTIPEGTPLTGIADIFEETFLLFDREEFLKLTAEKEGYLFPDTYLFFPNITAEDVVDELEETFEKKILDLEEDIVASGHSLEDIIIMASIVQAESHDASDQPRIASVFWNRIDIDMPLQADVTFRYYNDKTTFDLTLEDLEEEHPYNSYIYTGLPPTPINNPGLSAIEATINPEETDFLYFLADAEGTTHFSETFDEHVRKKQIYLP